MGRGLMGFEFFRCFESENWSLLFFLISRYFPKFTDVSCKWRPWCLSLISRIQWGSILVLPNFLFSFFSICFKMKFNLHKASRLLPRSEFEVFLPMLLPFDPVTLNLKKSGIITKEEFSRPSYSPNGSKMES